MTIYPCGDTAVGNEIAEFCGGCGIQFIHFISIFDGCECWEMAYDNCYLFGITLYYSFFDKYEISLKLIVDIL
ncbi:hypothetical protein [Phocaeicola sartorii]|uniref:hypothetical protein n=1 Tax=Phocaeicola sartorii TaxID=671267 RepID=UPI00258F90A4|nr:hypothetical protein [Phocaeicola sartorii]